MRYAPNLALLLIISLVAARSDRTMQDLIERYVVTVVIWVLAIVLIARLKAHSSPHHDERHPR